MRADLGFFVIANLGGFFFVVYGDLSEVMFFS